MLSIDAMTDQVLETVKAKLGGNAGVAAKLGDLTPQAVSQWKRVPANRARAISKLTGISCEDLRPDVFGGADDVEPDAA